MTALCTSTLRLRSGQALTEGFHEAQHLHVLPLASLVHAGLHQAAQGVELLGQLPSRQWGRLLQRSNLALYQRQVSRAV